MQILDFQTRLSHYPVFSLQEVRKSIPEFSYRQLDRWEKKGYVKKIRRGYYCFAKQEINTDFLFYTANKIYPPSYVSLEKALKFYGFIPEEVFQITSVGTKKTISFTTAVGNFNYRHIKPSLFWGYTLTDFGKQKILLAGPEKAILDYLYLNVQMKTAEDFSEMRINEDEFREKVDVQKFRKYLSAFGNKVFAKRAEIFLTTIHYA
jgi:predicted transcriptional regulator of viral defense system